MNTCFALRGLSILAGWNSGVSSTGLIQEHPLTSQPFSSYLQPGFAASCSHKRSLASGQALKGTPSRTSEDPSLGSSPSPGPCPSPGAEALVCLLQPGGCSGAANRENLQCAWGSSLVPLSARTTVLYVCVWCQKLLFMHVTHFIAPCGRRVILTPVILTATPKVWVFVVLLFRFL